MDTEAPLPIYYTVRGQDGVMRWLGASPGTPEALSLAEAVNIRWLAGQDLRPSTAREVMPGVLGFVDGPLAQLSDRIVRVDRHDRRAVVALPIGGGSKRIYADLYDTGNRRLRGGPVRPGPQARRTEATGFWLRKRPKMAKHTPQNAGVPPAPFNCPV